MKEKILITVIGILLVTSAGSSLFNLLTQNRNEKKIEELYSIQNKKLEDLKIAHKEDIDSLQIVVSEKQQKIKLLEVSLYQSLENAKINNRNYEKAKQRAHAINNVDSLSSKLTKRYQKR